jgi:putative protein-disulfide isomerase
MDTRDLEFVYVGDPMCSWCWGFAPVLEQLEADYDIAMRTVVGGLRPGASAQPLDDGAKRTIAHHWHQVEERSGQPFDHRFFDRDDWVYDTELPAIAVVAVRELNEKATLPFFTRLQRAFYAENIDITDAAVYQDLLGGFDVDGGRFAELVTSPDMKQRAYDDFAIARGFGITGFPTLLLREGDAHHVVTYGYAPADQLEPALNAWLQDRFGAEAAGMICSLDEPC